MNLRPRRPERRALPTAPHPEKSKTNNFYKYLQAQSRITFCFFEQILCTFVLSLMMNKMIHKISTFLLSIVFLLTTIGITLTVHHCNTTGQTSYRFFIDNPSCETMQCCHKETVHDYNISGCNNENEGNIPVKDCCSNKQKDIKLDSDFITTSLDIKPTPKIYNLLSFFAKPCILKENKPSVQNFIPFSQSTPKLYPRHHSEFHCCYLL